MDGATLIADARNQRSTEDSPGPMWQLPDDHLRSTNHADRRLPQSIYFLAMTTNDAERFIMHARA